MLHKLARTAFCAATVTLAAPVSSGSALAGPVNGTGLVTPNVIFGSGNANGSFTGVSQNNVELGLRGKQRYNTSGTPENTFNYDSNRTYTFSPADSNAPANRSAFNFEWAINVDLSGLANRFLDDLSYRLEIDLDPTTATDFVSFDPINTSYADHALGDGSTGNGGGKVAGDPISYAALLASSTVAQQSWNLGFFTPGGVNPQAEGLYTINLSAILSGKTLASTSIDIQYGAVPVPVPAALPLLAGGFGLFGAAIWRRQRKTA